MISQHAKCIQIPVLEFSDAQTTCLAGSPVAKEAGADKNEEVKVVAGLATAGSPALRAEAPSCGVVVKASSSLQEQASYFCRSPTAGFSLENPATFDVSMRCIREAARQLRSLNTRPEIW